MPRPTRKTKLNSTVFSEFYPGIASSPLNENQILNDQELGQHLDEHCTHLQKTTNAYKMKVLKHYEEAFKEFDSTIEECLCKANFDFPITVEIFKTVRAMFKNSGKDGIASLEKADKGNVDNQTYIVEPKKKGRTFNSKISSIETEDDGVFKKPTGSRRTTRHNSRINQKELTTPKRTLSKDYNVAKVTPGPNINRPVGILRRPVPGEMAVSMNGSPLVTNQDNISLPQMTIPLSNGRMMTFVANEGLDPDESLCGEIDPETQERLTVFYKLLEKNMKRIK